MVLYEIESLEHWLGNYRILRLLYKIHLPGCFIAIYCNEVERHTVPSVCTEGNGYDAMEDAVYYREYYSTEGGVNQPDVYFITFSLLAKIKECLYTHRERCCISSAYLKYSISFEWLLRILRALRI